jgi:predicted nucleic acid-binding protein
MRQAWRDSLAAIEIEPSKLPDVCVLDAGVMMLALNQRVYRDDSPTCRALWRALVNRDRLAAGARVLIPAPALAELIRGTSKQEPPRMRGIFIAPFTSRTARSLSQHIPEALIETQIGESKLPRAYLKYDALIAATAISSEATLIALDGWFHRQNWPIAVRHPRDFARAQMPLDLPEPPKGR